jgi:hypothetical protein
MCVYHLGVYVWHLSTCLAPVAGLVSHFSFRAKGNFGGFSLGPSALAVSANKATVGELRPYFSFLQPSRQRLQSHGTRVMA